MDIKPAPHKSSDVQIYEYGIRLDKECQEAATQQILMARRLYNELVARIREIVFELRTFVIEKAGPEALAVQADIDALNTAFDEAKAKDDEESMRRVAEARREKWKELSSLVAEARKAHKAEINSRFLGRIGKNSSTDTYKLRSQAVANGLGWATANAVLDAAIIAFQKSFVRGNPPRFASAADKEQDTLTLQFTAAGGVPVETLLAGGHGELKILPSNGCGRRKYGSFQFRLGAASANTYATGTWQYHRPLPGDPVHAAPVDGVVPSVGKARLVRRRIGKDYKWALQLQVKNPVTHVAAGGARHPLAAIHFGWAADLNGRRVAGVTDGADPGQARLVVLPADFEAGLDRAAALQGKRDSARDKIVPQVKELAVPDTASEVLREELLAIRRLPVQHVAIRRLHHLCRLLREENLLPDWLEAWRKADRLRWQSSTHIAHRSRNLRKSFYRDVAIDLARRYSAIAIEPLDLAKAAIKVDKTTGEKTDFAKKARSGRVVAAIYEFESAIRWAAVKTGAAVLEVIGHTATHCAICGSTVQDDEENSQLLHCTGCGADLDRKQNGAALAWQAANTDLEDHVTQFWTETLALQAAARETQAIKKAKMAEGRKNARTLSDSENT